jgi:death-on-curing protein
MHREPEWIPVQDVLHIHDKLIADSGGLAGVNRSILESALARPINRFYYTRTRSIFSLAAAYGYGVIKDHPFADGNKRTGYLCMFVFLGLNGYWLQPEEDDIVNTMIAIAEGTRDERWLGRWLRKNSSRFSC